MVASKPFRRFLAVGIALAVGGTVGGVAVASGGSPRHERRGSGPATVSLPRTHVGVPRSELRRVRLHPLVVTGSPRPLPSRLLRSFGVFRHSARASVQAAIGAAARVASGPAGQFPGVPSNLASAWGLVVGDATAIPNNAGFNLWLVPGATGTCFIWTQPSVDTSHEEGDCVPNQMTLAGELSPIAGDATGQTVIGLAPDGNTAVTLTLAGGSSETVPVSQNVYIAKAYQGFSLVTLKDSTGTVRVTGVPDGRP